MSSLTFDDTMTNYIHLSNSYIFLEKNVYVQLDFWWYNDELYSLSMEKESEMSLWRLLSRRQLISASKIIFILWIIDS